MVARVRGGKRGGLLQVKVVKRYKLPIIRLISSGDIRYNMVTIANSTILYKPIYF